MDNERASRTLDVRDKEIAEELLWRVEEGLRIRDKPPVNFDPLVDDLFRSPLTDDGKIKIRYAIERADCSLNNMKVDVQLRVARSIVDRVLVRIRRPLHELVVFYIGLTAAKQKVFNGHAILALRLLLEITQRQSNKAQSREAVELRSEVERLRMQIERLEDTIERLVRDKEEMTARQDLVCDEENAPKRV